MNYLYKSNPLVWEYIRKNIKEEADKLLPYAPARMGVLEIVSRDWEPEEEYVILSNEDVGHILAVFYKITGIEVFLKENALHFCKQSDGTLQKIGECSRENLLIKITNTRWC